MNIQEIKEAAKKESQIQFNNEQAEAIKKAYWTIRSLRINAGLGESEVINAELLTLAKENAREALFAIFGHSNEFRFHYTQMLTKEF